MRVVACEQGSLQWYEARIGIPTASQFHRIITPGGKPSTQAAAYMYRLIAERLLHDPMDDYLGHVQWAERGKLLEPDAASQFEFTHNVILEPVGFVTTDDGRVGCSPDRLIAGRCESVEIKCPAPWTHLQYLLEGPCNDYKPQVQGQLMIAELEGAVFYSYEPRMPPFEQVTRRDDEFIRTMRLLSDFLEQMDATLERARSLGAYVATPRLGTPMESAFPEATPEPLQIMLPD